MTLHDWLVLTTIYAAVCGIILWLASEILP
jgi:hypothetical protein